MGEVAVDGPVGREVVRQGAPGDAGAVNVQGAQVVNGYADAVAGQAPGFESGAGRRGELWRTCAPATGGVLILPAVLLMHGGESMTESSGERSAAGVPLVL
jgi:hypothetical protein